MSRPWRFVIPNLVTCLSLCAGFIGIAEAVAGRYESGAWFMLLCVLFDKADGTAARLLGASSKFGVELDSLSDLVGFGVAPAVLVLAFFAGPQAPAPLPGLLGHQALPTACAFFYVAAAALRLAKFNVMTESYGKEFFFGIPTTLCGAFVCCYFLVARKHGWPDLWLQLLPALLAGLGLLMVSRIPLPKIAQRKTLLSNLFTFGNVFFVYLFGVLRIFPEYLLTACASYLVFGSLWAISRGVKPASALASSDLQE